MPKEPLKNSCCTSTPPTPLFEGGENNCAIFPLAPNAQGTHSTPRRTATCAPCLLTLALPLLLSIGTSVAAGEAQPDAERIRRLAEQLGGDDYAEREAAMKSLRAMGEPVWPVLEPFLKHENLEVSLRVRALARDLAILTKEQETQVQELLAKLHDPADEMKRAEGLDGLLTLGAGGERLLKKELSGAGALPKVELEFKQTVLKPGEKAVGKAKLVNAGAAPYWLGKSRSMLRTDEYFSPLPFGEVRPTDGSFGVRTGGRSRRLQVMRSGYHNPIREWMAVLPGAVIDETPIDRPLEKIGVYKPSASFQLSRTEIAPRFPGTTDLCKFEVNGAIPKEQLSVKASTLLFVLPDLEKLPQDKELQLELSLASKQAVAGTALDFSVHLKNLREKKDPLRLESNLARYAWYALLDVEAVPVAYGSWRSVLRPQANGEPADEAAALKAKQLAPGASAVWDLRMKLPEKPGSYRLLAYYEVNLSFNEYRGSEEIVGAPIEKWASDGVVYYHKGRVGALVKGLVVTPPPKP